MDHVEQALVDDVLDTYTLFERILTTVFAAVLFFVVFNPPFVYLVRNPRRGAIVDASCAICESILVICITLVVGSAVRESDGCLLV